MPDFAVITAFRATDKLSPAFQHMGAEAEKFGRRGAASMGMMGRVASGVSGIIKNMIPIFGAIGIIDIFRRADEKADLYEVALTNIKTSLISTKGAAGLTEEALMGISKRLAGGSIFGRTDIMQNVTAQLLTFSGIGKQNFKRVGQASLDMTSKLLGAKATGDDLLGMSLMLGKALDSPSQGMGKLEKRIGYLNPMVKYQIMLYDAMGQKEKSQAMLLTELEKKFGGQAAALAATDKGMERILQKRIGELFLELGLAINPLKKDLLELALAILPDIIAGFKIFAGFIKENKTLIYAILGTLAAYKALLILIIIWKKIMVGIGWIQYLAMMWPVMMNSVKAMGLFNFVLGKTNILMYANPIGLVIAGIAALVVLTYLIIKNWNKWGAAMTVLLGPMGQLIAVFKAIYDGWEKIKKAFETEGVLSGLKAIGLTLVSGLLYPIQQLLELLAQIPYIEKLLKPAIEKIKNVRGEEVPPNLSMEAASVERQGVDVSGRIDLGGFPGGTKAISTGAPGINFSMVGANP